MLHSTHLHIVTFAGWSQRGDSRLTGVTAAVAGTQAKLATDHSGGISFCHIRPGWAGLGWAGLGWAAL